MRIVVVGGAGQVGRKLTRLAVERGNWVGTTYKARAPPKQLDGAEHLDKVDGQMCDLVLGRLRPDVVVDTGALHNVDYCETHPDEARAVNAIGTRNLAESSRRLGARFVFVSTDFVFDGSGRPPYRETDAPNPQSVYARSKLDGEEATRRVSGENLIVRPSVIYSWLDSRDRAESSSGKGLNFGTWLAEEVASNRQVRIINDQVASPTLADDLAGAILALIEAGASGLFHAAGATPATRYEFSRSLIQRLHLNVGLVNPVATRDLNQRALRPVNSSLSSHKLESATGYKMLELTTSLDRFARDWSSDPGKISGATPSGN
jgi:dTDP-4-dehydrorhamnose reductase